MSTQRLRENYSFILGYNGTAFINDKTNVALTKNSNFDVRNEFKDMKNSTLVEMLAKDSRITIPNSMVDISKDFTIEFFYIYKGELDADSIFTAGKQIISNGASSTNIIISLSPTGLGTGNAEIGKIHVFPFAFYSNTNIMLDKKWHHVVVQRKSNVGAIYIDGVLETTKSLTNAFSGNFSFGSGYHDSAINCKVAEFSMTNRAIYDGNFELPQKSLLTQDNLFIQNKSLILNDGKYKKWNAKIPSKTYQTILTPILTSNNPNEDGSGVIFSSESIWYKAFKAFDRKIPKIGDSYYWESMNSGTTVEQWIGYNFNKATMVEHINVTVPTIYNSQPDNRVFPSYIHIEGSNELVEWDTIKSFTNLTWISGETKKFDLGQHNAYKAYRLRMLSSGYANVDVAEIEMYGSITTEAKEGFWSTVSSSLPTSTKFLSDGMDSLAPLLDRKVTTLESKEMINKSEILGVGETGKVFSKTIDLKKYFDIRNMKVEVE